MHTPEPRWLELARRIQAIAQTGTTFAQSPYDQERYQELKTIAVEMLQLKSGIDAGPFYRLLLGETGYPTPKIDVRAAVFDHKGRILMVREILDEHRWTLPGGWADVNLSGASNVVKEAMEESGYHVAVRKLAAVWDRAGQGHPVRLFSCYKMFFVCDLVGGEPATSSETSEVAWFAEDELPPDLSLDRVTPDQLASMFAHHKDARRPTDFD